MQVLARQKSRQPVCGISGLRRDSYVYYTYNFVMCYEPDRTGEEPGSDDHPGRRLVYQPWDDSSLFRDNGIPRVSQPSRSRIAVAVFRPIPGTRRKSSAEAVKHACTFPK
jgi:hypothetical protein